MSHQLSPQLIDRVESFCNELLPLVEQCHYMADFDHTGFGYVLMEKSSTRLKEATLAIADSISSESVVHEDLCPLNVPCYYLLPQALTLFIHTSHIVLGFMQVISDSVHSESTQRLAYEYLIHTLSAHRETAGFILQTVIEELPKVEGLKALDTLKAESSASL